MKPIPRRAFLQRSTLAALAAPLSGGLLCSPPGRAVAATSQKLRVGLIGCGGMGKGDLSTFFLNPEVECPVVCDVDDAKLAEAVALVKEKRDGTCDTVKDFRRVLDRKDVDAVIVATPDHWHALPTILACQAGKDVYVEKPLALTIAEGRAMVEAAKQYQRICQMGAQRLSSPYARPGGCLDDEADRWSARRGRSPTRVRGRGTCRRTCVGPDTQSLVDTDRVPDALPERSYPRRPLETE